MRACFLAVVSRSRSAGPASLHVVLTSARSHSYSTGMASPPGGRRCYAWPGRRSSGPLHPLLFLHMGDSDLCKVDQAAQHCADMAERDHDMLACEDERDQ